MKGGALLGQGTFGCVFSPPLLCKTKPSSYKGKKGEVGKITQPIDIVNEITAAKILKDVKGNYFVLPNPDSVCSPSDIYKQPDVKSIEECTFIKEADQEGVVHFTMPYGGVAIRKIFNPAKPISNAPINLFRFATHILEGGVQLALHGYVHYDIHQENVLIDPKTMLPKFIDFGMSFSSNNITKQVLDERWKVYSPDYNPEPPEVTCITAVRKKMQVKDVLHDILKGRPILQEVEKILGISKETQILSLIKFWNSSKVIESKDWVKFFQLYWTSFDSWGIGVVILTLIRMTIPFYSSYSAIPNIAILKDLSKGLLCLDPRERLDCVEALSLLDPENKLIHSSAGKAWMKTRAEIRAAIKKL